MRKFLADTMAMVIFSTCVGVFIEVVISGLTLEQSIRIRAAAIPVMLIAGRPYGIYRDWCLRCLPQTLSTNRSRAVVDSLANLSFQVTLYILLLVANGADERQISKAVSAVVIVNLVAGRPYGLFLDSFRSLLKVSDR